MSVISFSRPHSNRPISLSLFSVISIDPFSLFARSPLLFCFSDFPHLLCFLCFFSNFPVFPASSVSLLSLFTLFSLRFSYFPLTLPCVLKRFPLTTSQKTTTTCAENVLTLTPECFHHHVFCCLCIRPSSLLFLFTLLRPLSLLRPHSTRPISLSLFSICSNFSLYLTLLPLFFRISLFSLTLPCVLKRFPLTTSRKTTTTCVENVLTLTPGHTSHDVLMLTPSSGIPSARQARAGAGAWRLGRP